jgi:hypothetical protein
MLLIWRKTVILMSYHVRLSYCIFTYGFMVIIDGANQARCPCCIMDFIRFSPFLSSVDDTRVQLKLSTTSQFSGSDYINASFIKVKFVLYYCMLFLLAFSPLFWIVDSTLKRGLKLAGYWGQQSFNIYFHSRATSQDFRGLLANGLWKSMSCDCYAHTFRQN